MPLETAANAPTAHIDPFIYMPPALRYGKVSLVPAQMCTCASEGGGNEGHICLRKVSKWHLEAGLSHVFLQNSCQNLDGDVLPGWHGDFSVVL